MGVPGFFKWLLEKEKKNKNLIRNRINKKVKYLMLDTNCLLHPCIKHVIDKIKDNPDVYSGYDRSKVELEIWQLITRRIDEMMDKVKPEIIYIAIDGVVPMSKILQQRQRRHRFYYDNSQDEICNDIYPITSIELTPGTEYMERIHLSMINYLKNINKKIKYIYSSYHIEGEGEHKILRYIKSNIKNNDTIVIYGLDADLLFLALSAMITNNTLDLYIMREKPVFDNKEVNLDDVNTEYNYVEIRELYNIIAPSPVSASNRGISINIPIPDFIVICYLIGNDFMPHLLTITFKKKGLDRLISAYENVINKIGGNKTIVEKDSISNKFVINYDFLYELFNEIAYTERNIWRPMTTKGVIVEEKIEFKNETEYYNNYLGINELEISKSTKKHIVLKYIEGIEWCMNYYLNNTNSWSWGYHYAIAPLIKDIITYFPLMNCTNALAMKVDKRELSPMEQLILAIPRETYKYVLSHDLITELRKNKNIGYMFPNSFSIDINKDDLYWKCPVFIPMVDYNEYVREIKKIDILSRSSNNISLNDNDAFTNI
jgi:5'-3' exonuclease